MRFGGFGTVKAPALQLKLAPSQLVSRMDLVGSVKLCDLSPFSMSAGAFAPAEYQSHHDKAKAHESHRSRLRDRTKSMVITLEIG